MLAVLVGVFQINRLRDENNQISDIHVRKILVAQRWASQITTNWVRASSALNTNDVDYIKSLQKDMSATSEKISEDQKNLEEWVSDLAGKKLLEEVAQRRAIYLKTRAQLIKRQAAGENVAAFVGRDLAPLAEDYLRAVNQVATHVRDVLTAEQQQSYVAASRSQYILVVCAVFALMLGIFFAFLIIRSIVRPLHAALERQKKLHKET